MRPDLIHRTCFQAVIVIGVLVFLYSILSPAVKVPASGYVVLPATATSPASYRFCDFAVHFNYLRQIRHHEIDRPYTYQGQVRMMTNWLPGARSGMPHAYSPVALLLMWPLFRLDTGTALLVVKILDLVLLLVLVLGYLRVRAATPTQAIAVLAACCGLSFFATICVGQTSVFTTFVLALGWTLLQRQHDLKRLHPEIAPLSLALVLWFLAFKPSIAMVWFTVLLGTKSWRAVTWAALFLIVTWLALGPFYGGWIVGLQNYAYFIGHYYMEAFPPFLQPGATPQMNTNFNSFLVMLDPGLGAFSFKLNQVLFQVTNIAVILLCWTKRFTVSQLFQAAIWNYLVFCPQLCATEDWVICLLVVEGNFFRPALTTVFKIALLWAIVNLRWGCLTDWPLFFPAKLALASWWWSEALSLLPSPVPTQQFPSDASR